MLDVAVIGAGPAGCSAAVQCRRLGLTVLLIDKTGKAGGLTKEAWRIENYPGLEKPLTGLEFTNRLRQFISDFDIGVTPLHVEQIKSDKSGFLLSSGKENILCRAVVIATGTISQQSNLSNVLYSVREVIGSSPESAIVIGGGEAAFDYALSLSGINCEVTLAIRSETPGCTGKLIDYVNARENISVLYNTRVESVERDENDYRIVLTNSDGKRRVSTDAVLVAIGRKSVLPDLSGAILIPGSTITSFPSMFICGDACLGGLGQIGIAVGQGIETAGHVKEYLRNKS